MTIAQISNGELGLNVRTKLNSVIDLTGTSHPFTSSSVVFVDGSGNFAQDNTNLKWNDSTNVLTGGVKLEQMVNSVAVPALFAVYHATATNWFIGQAGNATLTGSGNLAMGAATLANVTSGSNNVAVGQAVLISNTTGDSNLAMGQTAMSGNLSGSGNVALGFQALYGNTNGSANVAMGNQALRNVNGADHNISIGSLSGYALSSGNQNIQIGSNLGGFRGPTTGGSNVIIGVDAGGSVGSGGANTILGAAAGLNFASGSNNVFIGAYPGTSAITGGNSNTLIGGWAGPAGTISNVIALSDGAGNLRLDYGYTKSDFWTFPKRMQVLPGTITTNDAMFNLIATFNNPAANFVATYVQIDRIASVLSNNDCFVQYAQAGVGTVFRVTWAGWCFSSQFVTNDIVTGALIDSSEGGTGLALGSASNVTWANASAFYNTKDLGLARNAAGVLEINSGTAGTFRDMKLRSSLYAGSTSGVITVQPQAAAGTYNFNLPTTAGTAGQVLTSQGGGSTAMTWASAGAASMAIGSAVTGATAGSVLFAGAGPVLAQDNANFNWDDTNDVLSVGGATYRPLVVSSTDAAFGTGIGIANTSTGGHTFLFYSTGQSNFPGNFGVYDQTSSLSMFQCAGSTGNFNLIGQAVLNWGSFATFPGSGDIGLARNAAGVLEINNGTAGTFRDLALRNLYAYNAFTSSSNYERGIFDWNFASNVLTIGTQRGGPGAGSIRPFQFIYGGTVVFDYSNSVSNSFTFAAPTGVCFTDVIANSGGASAFNLLTSIGARPALLWNAPGSTFYVGMRTTTDGGGTHSLLAIGKSTTNTVVSGMTNQFFFDVDAETFSIGSALDTAIGRNAAGVLEINNGTAGTFRDLKLRSLLYGGTTSGVITMQTQAAAGTYNFNWPITAGSAGQVLTSQAGGSTAMTWTTPVPAASPTFTGTITAATANFSGPVAVTDTTAASSNTTGALKVTGGAGIAKDLYLATGTTAIAPMTFTSGINLSTARAGALEYDGTVFYASPQASSRAVNVTAYMIRQDSTYTLTSNTSVQKLFSTTNGAVTLTTGTYYFECLVYLTAMSATSGNAAFSLAGGATLGSILYWWTAFDGAAGAAGAFSEGVSITAATPAAMATAAVATTMPFMVKGTFEVTAQGTVIPSIQLLTASAAIVAVGSYFMCYPMGTTTLASVGNWS